MKLVTFNIRYDTPGDGANCFPFRKPLILRTIAEERPDILCFQEVLPHVKTWLKDSLTDYYVVGCPRGERLDGEQVSVAFRRDGWQLLEMRSFWLSETPFVPGSRYPDQSDCPRICTEVLLQEEAAGRVIRIMNTHLDHVGREARERGLRQILRRAEEAELFPEAPVILTGDFNAEPDSPEMALLRQAPGWVILTENVGVTYHGFGRANPPAQIDYIAIRGPLVCKSVQKWTGEENGRFLSDHYPICVELT